MDIGRNYIISVHQVQKLPLLGRWGTNELWQRAIRRLIVEHVDLLICQVPSCPTFR